MLQQWRSHLLYFNPGFCLVCVCGSEYPYGGSFELINQGLKQRGRKEIKNKGLIRIIAEQLLKRINLVPLQKILFGQKDHKQYSPKLETKRRGLGAECAYHC